MFGFQFSFPLLAHVAIPKPADLDVVFKHLETQTEYLGVIAAVLVAIAVILGFFEDKHKFLKNLNRALITCSALLQIYLAVKIIQFNSVNDIIQTARLDKIISTSKRADLADQHAAAADSHASEADTHAAEADENAVTADKDAKKAHDDASRSLASFAQETNKALKGVQEAVGRISKFEVVFSYDLPGGRGPFRQRYDPGAEYAGHPENGPSIYKNVYSPALLCEHERFPLTQVMATTGTPGSNNDPSWRSVAFTYVLLEPDRLLGKDISYLSECHAIRLPPLNLREIFADQNYQNLISIKIVTMKIIVNNADYLAVPLALTPRGWEIAIKREEPLLFWRFNQK
jgi:hypothetical protein